MAKNNLRCRFLNGKIKTNVWLEDSGKDLINFIDDFVSRGVNYIIPTDISKDGMLKGHHCLNTKKF